MNEGSIVEFIDQGRFVCSICLLDRGNRLHLLTPGNREVNLSPKRALLISGPSMDPMKPREELLERLRNTEERRNTLKGQVDVEELWELIREEEESFDTRYLAQLVFGKSITDDHLSALVRALFEDRLHFKMKDGSFLPNPEERVEQIVRQREEEALRERKLAEGSAWIAEIREGRRPEDPSCKEEIINWLIQVALQGDEAPEFKQVKELFSRAGVPGIQECRHLLVRLGIWEEDENLDLLRFGVETSFTQEQLEESSRLGKVKIPVQNREDLRDLSTFTIDGPLTLDFDDAISFEKTDDALQIGIHIADVSSLILPGGILERGAATRGSSLYLPRRQIPMIPPDLSHDTLSLKQGCDRPAISLLARFDESGELVDHRFVPSMIRVQRRLTYQEVNDSLLRTEPAFQEMLRLSQILRQKRMNQGALSISLPELEVKFNADSALSLELVDQNTPSRLIVAEFMILYNWLAARFCRDRGIPILFRTQQEPSERLSLQEAGYLFYVFQQRRKLSPLQIETVPKPHGGLGLDVYIQASSPIRRYLDLVSQRQIRNFLTGEGPLWDAALLEEIRMAVEPVTKTLDLLKRNRLRYWILKFLSQHRKGPFRALILDELKTKYRVVLTDFFLVTEIKRQEGVILSPGQEIMVEVKKASPWENLLELGYVRA